MKKSGRISWKRIFILCVIFLAAAAGVIVGSRIYRNKHITEYDAFYTLFEQREENLEKRFVDVQPETNSEAGAIDVYYWAEDAMAKQIVDEYKRLSDNNIEATSFTAIEEMDLQITAEIEDGNGPDVVLFPANTTLDTWKMAADEMFVDLYPFLAEDETFDTANYYSVLDAGVFDGRQWLMPLRFRTTYLLTSEEKKERVGLDLPAYYSVSELMEKLKENADLCREDESVIHILPEYYSVSELMKKLPENADPGEDEERTSQMLYAILFGGFLYDSLRLTDVDMIDTAERTVVASDDMFQEYAEFTKLSYEQAAKSALILKAFSRDFVGAIAKVITMISNEAMPYNMRYYDALFGEGAGETLSLLSFPNYEDPGTLTADITLYAAVLETSDQRAVAYEFVRFAMDSKHKAVTDDLSINRESVQNLLNMLTQQSGKNVNLGSQMILIDVLGEERRKECEKLLERITSGSIRNPMIEEIFTETMGGYITEEEDFEECFFELKNQLNLYLNE